MQRFSAADWCFFDGSVSAEKYYSVLKHLGFTGVEMVPPERRAAARAAGLEVINLSGPSIVQSFANADSPQAVIEEYVAAAHANAADGIPDLIAFSGNRKDARGRDRCLAGFAEVLRHTRHLPVRFLFEMFCEKDHPGYDGMGSAYGFWLARELNDPRFRVLYDVYHMVQEGEDPLRDISENADWIGHLHFAQTPDRSTPELNKGIDWESIVRISAGRWTFGLEFIPSGDRLQAAGRSIALLSELM